NELMPRSIESAFRTSSDVHRNLIVMLAARHRLPGLEVPASLLARAAGDGLISYGPDRLDSYRARSRPTCRWHRVEHDLRLTAKQVDEGRRLTAIGHVLHGDPSHHFEQLARDVLDGPVSRSYQPWPTLCPATSQARYMASQHQEIRQLKTSTSSIAKST